MGSNFVHTMIKDATLGKAGTRSEDKERWRLNATKISHLEMESGGEQPDRYSQHGSDWPGT